MNKIFVSFIAPFYNVNKFLPEFLESFAKFDKEKYELILVDDCGQEDASDIINSFKDKVNIKVIKNKKNLGLGFARNEGLKNISKKTTLVSYIDSDDAIDEDFDINWLENGKISIFDWKRWFKSSISISSPWNQFLKNEKLPFSVWGMFIPVDIALKNLFWLRTFEDTPVVADICFKNPEKIVFFRKVYVKYRKRKSSIMGSTWTQEKYDDLWKSYRYIFENGYLKKNGVSELFKAHYLWTRGTKVLVAPIDEKSKLWIFIRKSIVKFQIFLTVTKIFKFYNDFDDEEWF